MIRGPELIIKQPKELMDSMDEWCRNHHGSSGLTSSVLNSTISTSQAEQSVLDFIKLHIPEARTAVLAGNSVHVDRQFLKNEMPDIVNYLHYRIIDVSTLKELAKRWSTELFFKKKETHRAMDDILESIGELKYYRESFIIKTSI
jgi:oligoribonuclease